MNLNLKNVFVFLWSITPLIDLFANTTNFPNQIVVIYSFCIFVLGILILPVSFNFFVKLIKWLSLPIIYVISFIIISFISPNFDNSVRNNLLYLPLGLFNFINWFFIGYFFHESLFLKYLCIAVFVYSVLSIVFALTGAIDPDLTRIISGLDIPLAIVSAFYLEDFFILNLLMVFTFVSIQKTVIITSLFGYIFAKIYFIRNTLKKVFLMKKIQFFFISALIILPFLYYLLPFVSSTIGRFTEGEDLIRLQIFTLAFELLNENFPMGIGYNNFMVLSRDSIPYSTFTLSGEQIDGVALHNSFLHFALEGGLLILCIVLLLFYFYVKCALKLNLIVPGSNIGRLLLVFLVVVSLFGLVHQFHGTRYFWGVFALCFSIYERYNSQIMK